MAAITGPHRRPVPRPAARHRREFVRYLVLASGGFAAGNVGVALWASLRSINQGQPRAVVALADVAEGTAHLFGYPTGDDPAILVHLPGGELRAFSQKCTHLGCVDVVSGPPQRPLGRIDVEVRDGTVWALGARPEGGGH